MKLLAKNESIDPEVAIGILDTLSRAYRKQGNYGEAKAMRQKISETRKISNGFFAGVSRHLPAYLCNAGLTDCRSFVMCLRDAGRFQESIDIFLKCLDLAEDVGNRFEAFKNNAQVLYVLS